MERVLLSVKVRNMGGEEMGRQSVVLDVNSAIPTVSRPKLEYTAQDGKKYPAFIELEFCVEEL